MKDEYQALTDGNLLTITTCVNLLIQPLIIDSWINCTELLWIRLIVLHFNWILDREVSTLLLLKLVLMESLSFKSELSFGDLFLNLITVYREVSRILFITNTTLCKQKWIEVFLIRLKVIFFTLNMTYT